jgi:hypothetical protein
VKGNCVVSHSSVLECAYFFLVSGRLKALHAQIPVAELYPAEIAEQAAAGIAGGNRPAAGMLETLGIPLDQDVFSRRRFFISARQSPIHVRPHLSAATGTGDKAAGIDIRGGLYGPASGAGNHNGM